MESYCDSRPDNIVKAREKLIRQVCDVMVLGQLERELSCQGLYPLPSSPYHGLSFNDLAARLENMRLISMCEVMGNNYGYGGGQCGVKRAIKYTLDQLRLCLSGIELPVTT
jgi:hypothetical protein